MKEKDYYPNFTKKIKEIKKELREVEIDLEFFEKNYNFVKEQTKEREVEYNDNIG